MLYNKLKKFMEEIDRCIADIDSFIAYEPTIDDPNCWGFLFKNGTSALLFIKWLKEQSFGKKMQLNIFKSGEYYDVQFITEDETEIVYLEYVNIKSGYRNVIKNYNFLLMGTIAILPFCLVDNDVVSVATDESDLSRNVE